MTPESPSTAESAAESTSGLTVDDITATPPRTRPEKSVETIALAENALQRLVPLGPWIERCRRAGVPFVPAEFSPPFPCDLETLYWYPEAPGRDPQKVYARDRATSWAYRTGKQLIRKKERPVLRWECGSPTLLKWAMGEGFEYGPYCWEKYFTSDGRGTAELFDDPRTVETAPFGTLVPGPDYTTRFVIRPWVDAWRIQNFPVEFRLYYGPEGYQGVSSYYPQRALRPEFSTLAELLQPFGDALFQREHFPMGFTADFLIVAGSGPLFLEGGPPHWAGPGAAHPCCFPPGAISGVALESAAGRDARLRAEALERSLVGARTDPAAQLRASMPAKRGRPARATQKLLAPVGSLQRGPRGGKA